MSTRGLYDRKGELFAYLEGNLLHNLDGDATGRLKGKFIVDMAGKSIWRVFGDGVYKLDTMEAVGYFGSRAPQNS